MGLKKNLLHLIFILKNNLKKMDPFSNPFLGFMGGIFGPNALNGLNSDNPYEQAVFINILK